MTDDQQEFELSGDHEAQPRRKRAAIIILVILAIPFLALFVANSWLQNQLDPHAERGRLVELSIESGWGVARIGKELEHLNVIDSTFAFGLYARFGNHDNFQAGDYEISEGSGVREAVAVLEAGPIVIEVELSIIPGLWLTEVANEVSEQLDLDAATFLAIVRNGEVRSRFQPEAVVSAEGMLFPDTYRFSEDVTELDVVRTMVNRFDEIAAEISLGDANPETGLSAYEVVVAASLIQGEARLDSDRPLIASVIFNRIEDDMALQIDATVLYAIGKRKSSNTAEDRATESPYNTYWAKGLPPTPIATVARASLEAALHPAQTEYRFYVLSDPSGAHAFAVSYDEHLDNVARAREQGLLG